jgi:hypothetical protein
MGYGNVPDDWGCYYTNCPRCGSRYHQSEGGCGCMDDLECQCGKGDWCADWDSPRCNSCGSGPYQEGRRHSSVHIARKNHGSSIKIGDKYRRTVHFGHYPGGAFTLKVTKQRLEKGPMWIVCEVMES